MGTPNPPPDLLAGRRALDGLPGVELPRDWQWFPACGQWGLLVRLHLDEPPVEAQVATTSDWWFMVDATYPWGNIFVHPAKAGGLDVTFAHQNYNAVGDDGVPWRTGNICVATTARALGRSGHDTEPRDVHQRLRWNVLRTQAWLRAASRGELQAPEDDFELPQVPVKGSQRRQVAFVEGREVLATWATVKEQAGLVDFAPLQSDGAGILAVTCFRAPDGTGVVTPSWGSAIREKADEEAVQRTQGIWLRLPRVLYLAPFQAPSTWGELRRADRLQERDVDATLRHLAPMLRDGRARVALIGFPVPAIVAGPAVQMHWLALDLPALTAATTKPAGFRPTERGRWEYDHATRLRDAASITWISSRNWDPNELGSRGRLPAPARAHRVALIGAGALGSAVAEVLVRAGMTGLLVIDKDVLEVGNLVRHTLAANLVGFDKATALRVDLNYTSPHAEVTSIAAAFPPPSATDRVRVLACDVVIDSTGSDDVLVNLERFPWEQPRLFVSLSLGNRARRLFCFVATGESFPHSEFRRQSKAGFRNSGDGCKRRPSTPYLIDSEVDVWVVAWLRNGSRLGVAAHAPLRLMPN